ncbi:MAG: outer membrane beta-barrel protein [Thiomonas sp.]|jgi:hypothetical protein
MNKIALAAAVAAVLSSYGAAASAQTAPPAAAPAAPAAPSLGAVLAATPGLSLTGYVAATYSYFDDRTPLLRLYSGSRNSFQVPQAALTAAYLPTDGFGAQITAIAGSDAKVLRQGETWPSNSTSSQFDLNNAFVQYASGPLTVMAGKFSTLAGAEVLNPANDNEISRSLLFWNMEPGTHTGVRAAYAVDPALTLTAGVNNGWNFTSAPAGTGKTLELGASGSPNKLFSYSAAYYHGQSPLYGGSGTGVLQLLDLVGTLNATDALSFAANVDILQKDDYAGPGTGTGKANGVALYANYALTEQWTVSARGEYIDDKQGIVSGTAGANKLKEATLALTYAPIKAVKLMAEVRQDRSDQAIFTDTSGNSTTKQTSLQLQAVYSF